MGSGHTPAGVNELLRRVEGVTETARRVDRLGALLIGRPYLDNPLVGSAEFAERLVTRLDGFDCVTYTEIVLALALSHDPAEFALALRALRYHRGQVDWLSRNHYMSQWLAHNEAAGIIEPVLPRRWRRERSVRRLSVLPNYPVQQARLKFLPLTRVDELAPAVSGAELVCFVSERQDLDVFHVGLLCPGPKLSLRHASRSAGVVIEEELTAFLSRNRTTGLMVARLCAATGEG